MNAKLKWIFRDALSIFTWHCILHLKDLHVNLQKHNINMAQASVHPLSNICTQVSVEL